MPKWTKEIAIGFVPVLIIFLAFTGVNIVPILIAAVFVGALLFMMQMRGGITVGAAQERKRKKKVLPSLLLKKLVVRTVPSKNCVKHWTFSSNMKKFASSGFAR